LLAADAGARDEESAKSIGVGGSTVYRTKFVLGNLEVALSEEPRPGASRKLSAKRNPADGNGLFEPSRRPHPLDAGAAGR
jgi:hypothetical protein